MKKNCKCKSTSSGPRVINYQYRAKSQGFELKYEYVQLACDECDKPWVEKAVKK